MKRILATVFTLLVLAVGAIEPPGSTPGGPATPESAAEEPPPAPQPEAEPAEEAAPEGDVAGAGDEDEEELPPLPADTAPGPSPQRFNPTEKVRADFPVSFPIDI
jgi:hypothetical protein